MKIKLLIIIFAFDASALKLLLFLCLLEPVLTIIIACKLLRTVVGTEEIHSCQQRQYFLHHSALPPEILLSPRLFFFCKSCQLLTNQSICNMAYCRGHGEISNMGGTDDAPPRSYPTKKQRDIMWSSQVFG